MPTTKIIEILLHTYIITSLNCVGSITNQEKLRQDDSDNTNNCLVNSEKDYCSKYEVKNFGNG